MVRSSKGIRVRTIPRAVGGMSANGPTAKCHRVLIRPIPGVDRTYDGHHESDVNDPLRTFWEAAAGQVARDPQPAEEPTTFALCRLEGGGVHLREPTIPTRPSRTHGG